MGVSTNPEHGAQAAAREEAAIAEFMTTVNEARRKGRFSLGDEGTAPYFDANTKSRFNPLELVPLAGLPLSVHRGGQRSSPGGALVTPGEHGTQLTESAFAAAEVVTYPLSGPAIGGIKRLASAIRTPAAGNVALNRFRRETADLIASGVDPSTARQVAATNQGQTVGDMARLEKGLSTPTADPYSGLSTGQQTFDDTARNVQNSLERQRHAKQATGRHPRRWPGKLQNAGQRYIQGPPEDPRYPHPGDGKQGGIQ